MKTKITKSGEPTIDWNEETIKELMSKMSQFPWDACHDGACKCGQIWTDNYPVAIVTKGNWGDDYPAIRLIGTSIDAKAEAYMEQITYGIVDENTAMANAQFIAAAPEIIQQLLEEIVELKRYKKASQERELNLWGSK